jgi:hypothetical protein
MTEGRWKKMNTKKETGEDDEHKRQKEEEDKPQVTEERR